MTPVDKKPAICPNPLPPAVPEGGHKAGAAVVRSRVVRAPGTRRAAQAGTFAAVLALAATSAAVAASQGRRGSGSQQLGARTQQALLDLYALDAQVARAHERVAALEAASLRLQAQRAALRQELAADQQTLTASQQDLSVHLRDLYERGSVDPLAVLLGARSLDDAVSRLNALTSVADQSRRVVAVAAAARVQLAQARGTLARQQQRLAAALSSARAAAASLDATRSERLAYIAKLRAQQRQAQVAALVQQAQQIEHKSQTLQPPAPDSSGGNSGGSSPPPPPPSPPSSGSKLTVSATCYDLPGHTATGMPVGEGVVAVDPNVIPLGTKLYVPGYGNAVAADVGGGIKGAVIDLWMPYAQCMKWGRRTVTITIY